MVFSSDAGRNEASPELMPTKEQREYIYHRLREVRGFEGGKEIFVMDFQNDGEYVGGCIAGGRNYCHINPKGDVEPCVFIHYSGANIREKSLLECLKQPLFMLTVITSHSTKTCFVHVRCLRIRRFYRRWFMRPELILQM